MNRSIESKMFFLNDRVTIKRHCSIADKLQFMTCFPPCALKFNNEIIQIIESVNIHLITLKKLNNFEAQYINGDISIL